MGGGSFCFADYSAYSKSMCKTVDCCTRAISSGQEWHAHDIDEDLDPKNVIRECCNSDEHPNTLPVILALDVTGSMGTACKRTAEALGPIVMNLLEKYKDQDIEFLIMGIGDVEYDSRPIQASQFESDVRISKDIDKIYMEHGGGGNMYESYTAAWYFGSRMTKLDCFDKQGKKGIIITMGDEPLNPTLARRGLNESVGSTEQADIETGPLYEEASKKFDIYHIAVKDRATAYDHYESLIKKSFGEYLGDNLKVSTIDELPNVIEKCVEQSIQNRGVSFSTSFLNENVGAIKW